MARITLTAALSTIETLRHNAQIVETERDSLRAEVEALRAAAPAPRAAKPAYVRPQPTDAQREAHDAYVAALLAAKTLAMSTGRSVLVG